MKKILIVRTNSTPVNIKNYNLQEIGLAKALISLGNQADIVYFSKSGYKEEEINIENIKIKIYWVPGHSLINNAIFDKKIIKELCDRYDYIQVSEYSQYSSYNITKNYGDKVTIYHGPYYSKKRFKYNIYNEFFDLIFLKKYLKLNPKIISKSLLATDLLRKRGFKRIYTIGVGLDTSRFTNNPINNYEEIKEKVKNNKVILYIGKLEKRRNVDFIVKLLNEIKKEISNVKLIIIGQGNRKYLNKIKRIIFDNKLENSVIIIDSVSQENLPSIYSLSDIFILPSSYEIFGMVIMESMYFGVPVITTVNGGSTTIIDNEIDGYIMDDFKLNNWKNKIILHLNSEREMKEITKRKIKEKFMWITLAKKFLQIYAETKDNKE